MTVCTKCKEAKEDSCFSKNSSRKNGLLVHCKDCRKKRKKCVPHANIVGQKFNRLKVIKKTEIRKHRTYLYLCKCDCGKEILVKKCALLRGQQSCGCASIERISNLNKLPKGEAALNILYGRYKVRASAGKIEFNLKKDFFKNIIKKKCYYCDQAPGVRKVIANNGDLEYNGLDRIDSKFGYIEENVVPCCADCNWMKRSMSVGCFFEKIKLIFKKHNLNEHGQKIMLAQEVEEK